MLLFKLQFYQPSWFGAFGVEDINIEDDELKVYLKWTLHCIDLLYTATHIERSLLFFSDMHIRQKFQWTSEQLKPSCCTFILFFVLFCFYYYYCKWNTHRKEKKNYTEWIN